MPTKWNRRRITEEQILALIKPPTIGHVDEGYDVYIGGDDPERGLAASMWANNYPVQRFGLEGSLELYEQWLRSRPDFLAQIESLQGKVLGCTCRTKDHVFGRACHGDILRKIYIEEEKKRLDDAPEF